MQRNLLVFVSLFGFQMRSQRERTTCGIVMATGLLLVVYNIGLLSNLLTTKSLLASYAVQGAGNEQMKMIQPIAENNTLPLGTIRTSVFDVNIHWAIPYKPISPDELLLETKDGFQYVVLDISYRNISPDQEADLGMVILTTTIKDECGRVYYAEPLAIASLQREYPFPKHEEQYRKMRGVLKPGEYCRTTIIAFEAPVSVKNFILSMADGDSRSTIQHETKFTMR
ncbi:MAG: hypothetical protein EOO14_08725 [Chitinophagaceae bacterium]|nr:MAG: hypothetical protein EOO14_08725 [Chitinophagaceae bacterium]